MTAVIGVSGLDSILRYGDFGRQAWQGAAEKQGLAKMLVPVKGCRSVGKIDMVLSNYLPTMGIDAQTYEVRAGGVC